VEHRSANVVLLSMVRKWNVARLESGCRGENQYQNPSIFNHHQFFFFVVHLIDMNYVITVMPTGICVKVVSSNECIVINISFFSSEMNS
jgi:hypothetical protein